jgi:formylglycine-generating enzyme required for sulfatase activity
VARTIAAYHAHLSPVIPYEEQWVATQDAPGPLAVPAQDFGERLVKTLHTPHSVCGDTLSDWVHRLARWQPTQARMWRNDALAAAWTTIHLAQLRAGEVVHPPAGLDLARVSWLLAPSSTPRHYTLRQRGLELHIDQEEPPPAAPGLEAPGSLFTTLRATAPYIQVQQVEAEGAGSTAPWQALDRAIPLPAEGWCKLRTDQQELTIDSIVRPQWAESIGRDAYGLFVDVRLAGVVQRLRWIVPGEFTMGSPEDEAERFDVETPHQVILSQGFWLADTTCTQALWQAVMGENPSRFRGEDRPVDTVSWEKVQAFLTRCNAMAPELALRLPTEAEWEYACRAGTTTPFWFGEQITPEQVNYDGNYPYAGGKKGLYREETVPVKELPCNGWGLYQMHGNVWEWCQDRYAKYPAGPVIDPMGPGWGVRRVLRGGSWFSYGWNVRSAQRGAFGPGYRNDDAGFRLARGQVHRQVAPGAPGRSRGSRAGQTERSAVGQARRTRRGSRRKGTA